MVAAIVGLVATIPLVALVVYWGRRPPGDRFRALGGALGVVVLSVAILIAGGIATNMHEASAAMFLPVVVGAVAAAVALNRTVRGA